MKTLATIKKAPYEIGALLAQNKIFCGLLVDDNNDPQPIQVDYTTLLNEQYIRLTPPVYNGVKNHDRNTYCVLNLQSIDMDKDGENIGVSAYVFLVTNHDHSILADKTSRLLQLLDELYKTLDGAKISTSGEIKVTSANYTTIDDFTMSYRVSLSFSDQQIRKAEI